MNNQQKTVSSAYETSRVLVATLRELQQSTNVVEEMLLLDILTNAKVIEHQLGRWVNYCEGISGSVYGAP